MIYEKIHLMMKEVDYLQKDKENPHFHYKYVSDEATMGMFHALLVKHRVIAIPHFEITNQNGNMTTVSLSVTMIDLDDCGEGAVTVTIDTVGSGQDSGDKGAAKAMTMAYKYYPIKLFALATGDDPEADAETDRPKPSVVAALASMATGGGERTPAPGSPPAERDFGAYFGVPIPACTGHGKKARVWDPEKDGKKFRFYCDMPKDKQCAFVEYH